MTARSHDRGASSFPSSPSLFGHDVRFVIMNRSVISLHEVITWLMIHMLVIGAVVVALVALAWRRLRGDGGPDVRPVSEGLSR